MISPHPEKDSENMARMQELLGDVMPVELWGDNIFYYAPWDVIPRQHPPLLTW